MNDDHEQRGLAARVLIRCFLLSVTLLAFWGVASLILGDRGHAFPSRFFEISRRDFDLVVSCGLAFVKLSAFVFFLIPYIALRLVLRAR